MVGIVDRIKNTMFNNATHIRLQRFKMSNVVYESYTIQKNNKEFCMIVSRDSLMLVIGSKRTLTIVWDRTPEETVYEFVDEFEREIING